MLSYRKPVGWILPAQWPVQWRHSPLARSSCPVTPRRFSLALGWTFPPLRPPRAGSSVRRTASSSSLFHLRRAPTERSLLWERFRFFVPTERRTERTYLQLRSFKRVYNYSSCDVTKGAGPRLLSGWRRIMAVQDEFQVSSFYCHIPFYTSIIGSWNSYVQNTRQQ